EQGRWGIERRDATDLPRASRRGQEVVAILEITTARKTVGITLRVMGPRHAERDDYGQELPRRGTNHGEEKGNREERSCSVRVPASRPRRGSGRGSPATPTTASKSAPPASRSPMSWQSSSARSATG